VTALDSSEQDRAGWCLPVPSDLRCHASVTASAAALPAAAPQSPEQVELGGSAQPPSPACSAAGNSGAGNGVSRLGKGLLPSVKLVGFGEIIRNGL